jgi:hypothetical protein
VAAEEVAVEVVQLLLSSPLVAEVVVVEVQLLLSS